MSSPFPLEGEPLVIDLLNTQVRNGAELVELLPDANALQAWVSRRAAELPGLAGGPVRAAAEVRLLRDAIRRLFEAVQERRPVATDDVTALNRAAASARSWVEAVVVAGHLRAERRGAASLDEQLVGRLGEAAIEFLVSPAALRVRRCEGPGCVLLFLPTRTSRRWCSSTTCGNRVRVARHYQRQLPRNPS